MSQSEINPFEPVIDAIAEAIVKKVGALSGLNEVDERLLLAEEAA